MVFLQQENLQSDALGRITLGPLECVETSKDIIDEDKHDGKHVLKTNVFTF